MSAWTPYDPYNPPPKPHCHDEINSALQHIQTANAELRKSALKLLPAGGPHSKTRYPFTYTHRSDFDTPRAGFTESSSTPAVSATELTLDALLHEATGGQSRRRWTDRTFYGSLIAAPEGVQAANDERNAAQKLAAVKELLPDNAVYGGFYAQQEAANSRGASPLVDTTVLLADCSGAPIALHLTDFIACIEENFQVRHRY